MRITLICWRTAPRAVDSMATLSKPILHNGFSVADGLSVKHRVEKIFFTEVYSLSDGRFLYLFTKVKPDAIPGRKEKHGIITITANGEEYPCAVVNEHSREKVLAIAEGITSLRGLDNVAGMNGLKRLLINDVINPLLNPEKYQKFRLSIPNGILLYGPPGCGKTFIVKKLAEELAYNMFELNPSAVATPYVHGAVSNIAKVFELARMGAPAIVFIDEIEGLIPKREELGAHADIKKEEINEFLLQLNNAGHNRILVVGATNRPQMIDTAILRSGRMDKRIYVPPPDFEARREMFHICLVGRPYDQTIDFETLARMTENYVGSDIELIVTDAARDAVINDKTQIDERLIERVITRVTPSISQDEMDKFGQFANMERW
jgi:ATP-dependent 26S proteasome regulatory subunit